jgi:glycosyltransferase involved in cell wall biosynthesis
MSDRYFLYVGNAYPHKNLNRLIEAVVLLNKKVNEKVILKMSSARNVFIERLKESINKSGAEEFIQLLGFVPDEKLPDLYKNSVAFVFPSLSEGFGLPGLEAIEAGALVLASNIPVFREVYQNHTAYFDPNSVDSIEKTMEKALRLGADEREKIIREAQEFAKRYSWAKMAKETLTIYEEAGGNSLRSGQ